MAIGRRSSGRGSAPRARGAAGRWQDTGRRARALTLGPLLLVLAATYVAGSSFAGTAAKPLDKVDPAVVEAVDAGGETTFWAILREKADLSAAAGMKDPARGQFVYNQLTSTAERSQAGLRALLDRQTASYKTFWIANAIRIRGDASLLQAVAARPEVEQILPTRTYEIPKPLPGGGRRGIDVVEWNIDRIRAPLVWTTFGDRGENIVVANVDTGVQHDHNALVVQYRGNLGGGNFDHNYNWFDPSNVCGNPSTVPCDNNGHGTHTMGTMVGDDGDPGPNQIGVAPRARFIAAKGCESNFCSDSALLASAQWILAPTDLQGQNPRPDLRPHVVNNSWGGGGGDPWYQASVDAWVASGIFPAFSNGNSGSSCGTSGSPGDYTQSYSAGAFDINNNIAGFSSRGPSAFGGELKPNIAAPGVGVRSSVPFNSYASFSGTSMASPHVGATVALIWSAAPAIERDIAETQALLDTTAVDTSDLSCGGTDADNNVWGEGKLDAFAAVDQAPRGPTGTLTGTVTEAGSGNPIAGATVHASGPAERTTTTNAAGQYSLIAPVGTYDVTASAFGFVSETVTGVVVSEGGTTVQDFALDPAPSQTVSGHVRDGDANALANATVTILGTPIPPATTDANGFYSFASVPEGEYDVRATAGRCNDPQTQHLVVDGPETLDFVLPQRSDSFGYFCRLQEVSWIDANTVLPLSGDDASTQVSLPFAFTYYGQTHNTAHVSTNGFLNFLSPNATFFNSAIPSTFAPNGAIYPLWDDLFVDGAASVRTELLGVAPSRRFVIEWRNVHFFGDSTRRVDFEVVLHENGRILTQYRNLADDGREKGNSATIGIENQAGTVALQYSFNEASLDDPEVAVLYRVPPSGFVEGRVTDANDNQALAGASIKAFREGSVFRETTTDSNGNYRMQLPLGSYTIEASASNYASESADVVLDEEDEIVTEDFVLRTARAEVNPNALEFIVTPNSTKTKQLVLRNTGSLEMTWQIREAGGGRVATSSTVGIAKNPGANPNARTTEGLYTVDTPSGWSPTAPGDVIRTWPPTGLSLAWGVGYTGNVWLSDIPSNNRNHEFTVTGSATGRNWPAPWAGAWPGDMALDTANNCMAQVNVGGDNGIYCWNIDTGAVVYSITGGFPWTGISQRGLAYRPDDNSFYIGGWNEGIVYHVRGRGAGQGEVIDSCSPPDFNISGLAWNPAFNILWQATNSPTDTIYQLDPSTCSVLSTLPHPNPGFGGAGLEMDEEGNLWMIDQSPNNVYLIESGVPAFTDVPWLSEDPSSGTLPIDGTQTIDVTVNTAGMSPGVYNAILFVQSNSGRQPTLRVPVSLIVPAYRQGVNAGGALYSDVAEGDPWAADQAYSAGGWGYVGRARSSQTSRPIAGTDDDPKYQDLSRGMSEYRFDATPNGVYQVELNFAELSNRRPGQHIYDVLIEGNVVLFAHDVSAEVGTYTADNHSFFVPVTDGALNVRFVGRRGFGEPEINALRATHRPDR